MMTSWTGFSLKWYVELFNDQALLSAARLSLLIAALTATAAVIIGTWAGYVLARMGRFRGFALYIGMVSAPLVMPEVVLGISLLLMFVEISQVFGWPDGTASSQYRSEEHTSELQSLMRISYAVFCLKKKK